MRSRKDIAMYLCLRNSLLLTGLVFCTLFTRQNAQAKDIIICYESTSFLPYFEVKQINSEKTISGVVGQILNQAIIDSDATPKYVGYPWKRCLKLLQLNKVDGTFSSIYRKDREVMGRYPMKDGMEDKSRCLAKVSYHIFTSKNKPVPWNGIFNGENKPDIGAPLGYVVVQSLLNKHNIRATTGYQPAEGFRLVSVERLDGYIIEKVGGKLLLHQENLEDNVAPIDPPFENHFWHFMISHKFYNENPEVSEAIWDEIKNQRLKNFSSLMKKYLAKAKN